MKFYSRYDTPQNVVTNFFDPSLTQQHFKNEVNINSIIARYRQTGFLTDPNTDRISQAQFGDYTSQLDFHEAQTIISTANQQFAALPSDLRKRFNNDPAELLKFMEKEENLHEAISLGLVNPRNNPNDTDRTNGSVQNDNASATN